MSQRHSGDVYAWRVLAETLQDPTAASASRSAIDDGRSDARELQTELMSVSAGGTPRFPLLGGPKVGSMWIRLLACPGNARIASLEVVPVAVDVQVRKITEYLGVTDTGGLSLDDARPVIAEAWARDVMEHGSAGPSGLSDTSAALDPALWFYAKWGCTFCLRARRRLPISPVWERCRYPDTGAK